MIIINKKLMRPLKSLINTFPIMLAVILLLGLIKEYITFSKLGSLFTQNAFIDTGIGSILGSVFAGNSMNSYIISRELLAVGVSMFAVTAFLVSWVTVGVFQSPIEAQIFGISFAVKRNLISALLAMLVSFITVTLWGGF